jgi:hypothetical protein
MAYADHRCGDVVFVRGHPGWPFAAEAAVGGWQGAFPGPVVRYAYDESVDLVELGRLSAEEYAELVGDEEDPWGAAGSIPIEWRPKDRHVAVCDADGQLIAAAGLAVAEVQFGKQPPIAVAGLAT